jgi:hypothetical protein
MMQPQPCKTLIQNYLYSGLQKITNMIKFVDFKIYTLCVEYKVFEHHFLNNCKKYLATSKYFFNYLELTNMIFYFFKKVESLVPM